MTAPDTIFTWRYTGEQNNGGWNRSKLSHVEIQYTRTDLAEAETRAAVAAAYERAAQEVDCRCGCRDEVLNAKTKVERWNACGHPSCAALDARDIRALATDEQRSALEAVRRDERNRVLDMACERLADNWSWEDADFLSDVLEDLRRHILGSHPAQESDT